jgi:diguanylate cyclase (GGDEF)-like protein
VGFIAHKSSNCHEVASMDDEGQGVVGIDIAELDAQLAEMERLVICLEELAESSSQLSLITDQETLVKEAARHIVDLFNPCAFGIYTEAFEDKRMRLFVFNPSVFAQDNLEEHVRETLGRTLENVPSFDGIEVLRDFLWETEPRTETKPNGPIMAWNVCPIHLRGVQSGLAFIVSSFAQEYSKDYANLFQLFASTVGSYLENLRLLSETQKLTLDVDQQLEEQERLIITLEIAQEASQRISQIIEIEDLTKEFASSIREIFNPQAWGYLELGDASFSNGAPFRCILYPFHSAMEANTGKIANHLLKEINRISKSRFLLESDLSIEVRKDFLSQEAGETQEGPFDTFIAHPMTAQDRRLGIGFMYSDRMEVLSQDFLNLFYVLTRQFSATFENIRLFKKTEWYATYDTLTNLYNRRTFEELLQKQLARSKRTQAPFALAIVDIDHFKKFNDTYGHEVGDVVLRQVAGSLKDSLRINDVVARYGGEEFVVIFTDTKDDGARIVADRLRQRVEGLELRVGFQTLHVTISVGVAVFPEHGTTRDVLIEHADEALYRAKNGGRNRVTFYE